MKKNITIYLFFMILINTFFYTFGSTLREKRVCSSYYSDLIVFGVICYVSREISEGVVKNLFSQKKLLVKKELFKRKKLSMRAQQRLKRNNKPYRLKKKYQYGSYTGGRGKGAIKR